MHINLILEAEQRSASLIPIQAVVRIVIGGVGLLAALALVSFYTSYRALQREAELTQEEWKHTEPKYKAALDLRTDLAVRNDLMKEISGWRDTRLSWGTQLAALRGAVPSLIQLSEITASHDLFVMANNTPARVYELRLTGRVGAAQSEAAVNEFTDALHQPPFKAWLESAVIPAGRFRQDPQIKTDRIFEIICKYKPRRFE